jgi:putative membrane protein
MDQPHIQKPRNHFLAFILRLVLSAAVLWLSVGWVSPGNPRNTFGRAVLVSLFLSLAYFVTLVRFLWFLVVPWLIYALIWLWVIMASYGLSFFRSLLLALALTLLSWLTSVIFGVRTLRS